MFFLAIGASVVVAKMAQVGRKRAEKRNNLDKPSSSGSMLRAETLRQMSQVNVCPATLLASFVHCRQSALTFDGPVLFEQCIHAYLAEHLKSKNWAATDTLPSFWTVSHDFA